MASHQIFALVSAAAAGDLEALKKLVADGVSPAERDYDRRTPLHLACSEGHLEVVKYLVSELKVDINPIDRWGSTPLADCIRSKYWDCASFLKKHGGVASNAEEKSVLGVVVAAAKGNEAEVQAHIQQGNDLNATDEDGRSALHHAVKQGSVSLVTLLLKAGASPNVVDSAGHTPLMEAQALKNDAIIQLLREHGAQVTDLKSFRASAGFEAFVARCVNLIRDRERFPYAAAWVLNGSTVVADPNWSSDDASVVRVAKFRQAQENVSLNLDNASDKSAVLTAIRTKSAVWVDDVSTHPTDEVDALRKVSSETGFKALFILPVHYADELVMAIELRGFDSRAVNQNTITDAAITASRLVASSISLGSHVWTEQSETVYRLVLQEAQFHPQVVAAEVDWFYNHLGLDDFYFRSMSPAVIARHVLAFIAAKLHGNATGTAADVEFISEEENGALYVCPVDRINEVQRRIESKYLNEGYEGSGQRRPTSGPSVKFFVSRGTAAANNNTKLAIFIVRFYDWLQEKCADNETDIWKLASGVFLREKAFGSRERYAKIVEQASRSLGPVISVTAPQKAGEDCVITVGYKVATTHSFSSSMTQLLQRAGITVSRSYVETFANGTIVHSIHCGGRPYAEMNDIVEQASLLWILPRTSLTPLVEKQKLTLPEACYAYAGWKFAFHFASTKSEEFNHLWKALSGDADARSDLLRLKKRIRTDVATEQRIADTIFEQVDVIKELFRDFTRFHAPGSTDKPVFNAEIWNRLQKQILNPVDLEVLRCFLVFNANLLKTNFFYRSKTALAFRFNPSFLADEYPVVPFGLFMILSAEARGFHVRFDDVARGGIRLIRSRNKQLWQRNAETVFDENYNLAWTQQKKNKDIPEGGSKGTILLNIDHQEKAIVAFHKYIDGMLDCLLPTNEMKDHFGKTEFVFCGPDEGTADVMDWAALYAKKRGYGYWSAFTTGKSVELGGIPHDLYGMTTRGVHQYVLGVLRKLGLDESHMRKGQTGGPDGDLGSNEIKISKDKTIWVVDGSGVLYDPEGLDRTELTRLATSRVMGEKFDKTKLSAKGFFVHIDYRDVKLPSGELVESGMNFRNNFHLNKMASSELFVPCGGRPEAVNISNVDQLFVDGKPIYKYIIEGANLFFTQDARIKLEQAGAIVFKDASANKGGVTSSSLEVLSALALSPEEYNEHMCVKEGVTPAFYKSYVEDVQKKIEDNAAAEFECLWNEAVSSGIHKSILTDRLSERINELNYQIRASGLFANDSLRKKVLSEVIPSTLLKFLGLETVIKRLPESYIVSILSAHLASRYVYEAGLSPNEFKFYQFMQKYL